MNSYKNPSAVVLGLFETGLFTMRALCRRGIIRYGYDYKKDNSGFKSKYGIKVVCPHPVEEEDNLVSFLLNENPDETKRVLYPASDEYVDFVSRNRKRLEEKYLFNMPDEPTMGAILSKDSQNELVKNYEENIPCTVILKHDELLSDDIFEFPIFVKPVVQNTWTSQFNGKGFLAKDKAELDNELKLIQSKSIDVILQEVIPGPCTNNIEIGCYFDKTGECIEVFSYMKLRQYPSDFGVGTIVMHTHIDELETRAVRLLKSLNWRGFANVEYKLNPKTGKYMFIEINARVWQQISHPEELGINFPVLQYEDLIGGLRYCKENNMKSGKKENTKWVNIVSDLNGLMKEIKSKKTSIPEVIKSYGNTVSFGLFTFDDPKPFLYEIKYGWVFIRGLMKIFGIETEDQK